MARQTSEQRRRAAHKKSIAALGVALQDPAVRAAMESIGATALQIWSDQREDDDSLEEQQELVAAGIISADDLLSFQFDGEVLPYSIDDPFVANRKICADHGVLVRVVARSDGRPVVIPAAMADAGLTAVKLLPQVLVPMPPSVNFVVDLGRARTSRQGVVAEFEALLDNLLDGARHPLDPDLSVKPRPRKAAQLLETVAMLNLYETGHTLTKIGHRFGIDRKSVQRRIVGLCRLIKVPMPKRGHPLVAAPPGGRCKDCPRAGCVDCGIAQDPSIRETYENDRKWDSERVLPVLEMS